MKIKKVAFDDNATRQVNTADFTTVYLYTKSYILTYVEIDTHTHTHTHTHTQIYIYIKTIHSLFRGHLVQMYCTTFPPFPSSALRKDNAMVDYALMRFHDCNRKK